MAGLLATLRAAAGGERLRTRAETDQEEEMEGEEPETDAEGEEPETEGEGEEPEPEAEGEEPETDAEDEEPEPEAEDEDEPSDAAHAATMAERSRIVSILTHERAEANKELAVAMVLDGMNAARAARLLDAAAASSGAPAGKSLAARMANFQRGRRAGTDTGQATGGNRLVTLARARKAAREGKGN